MDSKSTALSTELRGRSADCRISTTVLFHRHGRAALRIRVKICTRCGLTKALDQFPPVRRSEPDKRQSWCRACFAEVNNRNYRPYYWRDHERIVARIQARRDVNRQRVIEYLREHSCVDCGEADVIVLQFDHRSDKSFDVASMIAAGTSWTRISAEMSKCDMRCANCHHRKTALERGYRKLAAVPRSDLATRKSSEPLQLRMGTSETITCRVCRVAKPVTEFYFRSRKKGTRQRICRACRSDYHRAWWRKNRVDQMPRIRRNRKKRDSEIEQRIWNYLFTHACVDCGETDLAVLQFDHLRDKVAAISTIWRRQGSWRAVELEISKCEVRCANCHARKTARELGNYKTRIG